MHQTEKSLVFQIFKMVEIDGTIFSINLNGIHSVIKSNDNCMTWDSCMYAPLNEIGASTRLYDLIKNGNSLFAPSDNGKLFHSFDKGETWSFTSFAETDDHPLKHVRFVNENVGFVGAIEGSILTKTTDGGKNWNHLPLSEGVFPDYFALLRVLTIDENTVFVVGRDKNKLRFFKTLDGGLNWNEFESELFKESQHINQEYYNLMYKEPYIIVENRYKDGSLGYTSLMRSLDFKTWEPFFISDTIGGGKFINEIEYHDDLVIGFGSRIFIVSSNKGESWVDLYDESDEMYRDGNHLNGFYYNMDNKYLYAQGSILREDSDGILRNIKKMFRYKLDIESSVETELRNLTVYPNPAQSEVNITYEKGLESIEVIDINGRNMISFNGLNLANEKSINVDALSTGTYFIRINDKIYKRFVKE